MGTEKYRNQDKWTVPARLVVGFEPPSRKRRIVITKYLINTAANVIYSSYGSSPDFWLCLQTLGARGLWHCSDQSNSAEVRAPQENCLWIHSGAITIVTDVDDRYWEIMNHTYSGGWRFYYGCSICCNHNATQYVCLHRNFAANLSSVSWRVRFASQNFSMRCQTCFRRPIYLDVMDALYAQMRQSCS